MKKIYLGSDHAGFKLKTNLINFLEKNNYTVEDFGPFEFNIKDDYPDYAIPLAKKVAKDKNSFGILICRNGQGMCIAANKVKGIRAVVGFSKKMIKSTRLDDNANILCLPAGYLKTNEAKRILKLFLETKFSKLSRHQRRLNKVNKIR